MYDGRKKERLLRIVLFYLGLNAIMHDTLCIVFRHSFSPSVTTPSPFVAQRSAAERLELLLLRDGMSKISPIRHSAIYY